VNASLSRWFQLLFDTLCATESKLETDVRPKGAATLRHEPKRFGNRAAHPLRGLEDLADDETSLLILYAFDSRHVVFPSVRSVLKSQS
jgi:hypothetical protein